MRLTYRRLDLSLHQFDDALVDPDSQVTQDLSVLRQVKVAETVLCLLGSVVSQEYLQGQTRDICRCKGTPVVAEEGPLAVGVLAVCVDLIRHYIFIVSEVQL